MDRSRSSTPTWTCIRFMAGISSYGRKRRVADVVHHRFEVVANLAREAQSFDDSCRAQQGQDPDIVKRELAVDGARALDQAIKLFQVRHELSDVLASVCPQFNEIAQGLALAQVIVIERCSTCEFRQP